VTGIGSWHPGANLAFWGAVVYVSFNYRLGAFGFLAYQALSEESEPVYRFVWDHTFADPRQAGYGAAHGHPLPFVLRTPEVRYEVKWSDAEHALSDTIAG
jgi:carboxylesterase type B